MCVCVCNYVYMYIYIYICVSRCISAGPTIHQHTSSRCQNLGGASGLKYLTVLEPRECHGGDI